MWTFCCLSYPLGSTCRLLGIHFGCCAPVTKFAFTLIACLCFACILFAYTDYCALHRNITGSEILQFRSCRVIVGNLHITNTNITGECSRNGTLCSSSGLFPNLTDISGYLALTSVIIPERYGSIGDLFPSLAIIHGMERRSYSVGDVFVPAVRGAIVFIEGMSGLSCKAHFSITWLICMWSVFMLPYIVCRVLYAKWHLEGHPPYRISNFYDFLFRQFCTLWVQRSPEMKEAVNRSAKHCHKMLKSEGGLNWVSSHSFTGTCWGNIVSGSSMPMWIKFGDSGRSTTRHSQSQPCRNLLMSVDRTVTWDSVCADELVATWMRPTSPSVTLAPEPRILSISFATQICGARALCRWLLRLRVIWFTQIAVKENFIVVLQYVLLCFPHTGETHAK